MLEKRSYWFCMIIIEMLLFVLQLINVKVGYKFSFIIILSLLISIFFVFLPILINKFNKLKLKYHYTKKLK